MFDSRVTRVLQGQQVFMARAAAGVILVSVAWTRKGGIHTQSTLGSCGDVRSADAVSYCEAHCSH